MEKVGERVVAILDGEKPLIRIFGCGVRVEDEVPTDTENEFSKLMIEQGTKNPCILLDDGKKVFGCECWWGKEVLLAGYKSLGWIVEVVDIEAYRKEKSESVE